MNKSIPPTEKHKDCDLQYIPGPFGPHQGKFICPKHKNAFVMWASKKYKETL